MERWQKPEAENARGRSSDQPIKSSLDYNSPLRSVRGDATAAPSPFYKLSAELSRESLRIPGAVPFLWEQSPGRRKFMGASPLPAVVTSPHSNAMRLHATCFVPETASTLGVDPAKKNLAMLFRPPSLKGGVADMPASADSCPYAPISSAIPQILPPPAADHARSSSARYSVIHRNTPPGTSFNNAALHGDTDDDAVSENSISDAVTATVGEGLSVDDSLALSGALRPNSTPSEARDFIMHRFLPAAHTIACESPQTPSRRFLPPMGIAATPCSPSVAGSFRDYTAACRPSPLRYASASSTPASNVRQVQSRGQIHAQSFHDEAEEEEEEDEYVEEEPPFTPKACGIFPFRITISFNNRHSTGEYCSRRNPSSKHQHNKQQHQKKSCKSINCAGSPMRIMDILHDDHSSSHDDESPVHRLRSKQSEAERERTKIAILEQAGLMLASKDRRTKPPFDSYHRGSPNLHQLLTAQHAASELSTEEASEYGSYQDAPSRFQSPSPAAFHLNARASRANYNMQPHLVSSIAQRSRSSAGLQDENASAAIIRTTEQHLLDSSFYYYNIHTPINKPHYNQPQIASPSTYHTPLSSHVGAPHQGCTYHSHSSKGSYDDTLNIKSYHDITANPEQCNASNQSTPKTHIIDNALYEHEDQDITNTNWNASHQAGQGGGHGNVEGIINGDHHASKGEHHVSRGVHCVSKGDYSVISNGDRHMSIGHSHSSNGIHHPINGDLHGPGKGDHHVNNANPYVSGDNHYVSNGSHQGDHYVSNNYHYASQNDPHYVLNGDNHLSRGVQYVSKGINHAMNGDQHVITNGDVHRKSNSSFPASKSLLSPPLPMSPTHSWLDRAMPLVASTNKSLGTSTSRLSHMRKSTATPGDDYVDPVLMSKMKKQGHPGSTEASKWEALVKGSHLQPGHLRFSEELFHQSQSVMKVGAS